MSPAEARARVRDETGYGQAAAIAVAMLAPALPHDQPVFAVEVELLAAACYGLLPLPVDYANSTGQPTSADERAYQGVRGAGDGRRVPWHVVPKLCAPRSSNDVNRTWRLVQPERAIPTVSAPRTFILTWNPQILCPQLVLAQPPLRTPPDPYPPV